MKSKIENIVEKLHDKFGINVNLSVNENLRELDEAEIKSSALYYLGEILNQDINISDTQKEISKIYKEIFTDLTLSIYLGCCSIDNSPKILLRRVLELGIATLYLWDLPYKYWNWVKYDEYNCDLNFKEMLDYLDNNGYIDFINKENDTNLNSIIKKESINKVYRNLSNVIHGKSDNFESMDSKSFEFSKEDLLELLSFIIKIENILLSILKTRFPKHFEKTEERIISLKKYNYEY